MKRFGPDKEGEEFLKIVGKTQGEFNRELLERAHKGDPLAVEEVKQRGLELKRPDALIKRRQEMAKLDNEFLVLLKDQLERFEGLKSRLPKSPPN